MITHPILLYIQDCTVPTPSFFYLMLPRIFSSCLNNKFRFKFFNKFMETDKFKINLTKPIKEYCKKYEK